MRHQVLSKIMPPLYNYISTSSNGFSDEIIQTILELGSDTEDNINCRHHIELLEKYSKVLKSAHK